METDEKLTGIRAREQNSRLQRRLLWNNIMITIMITVILFSHIDNKLLLHLNVLLKIYLYLPPMGDLNVIRVAW